MASSRLSRRSHYRRLGGRGHPWRRARSPKALLQLRFRPYLFRAAAMLHPARTLLGWMGLAHSPSRGLLLSRRGVRGGRQMPGGQRTVSVDLFRQRNAAFAGSPPGPVRERSALHAPMPGGICKGSRDRIQISGESRQVRSNTDNTRCHAPSGQNATARGAGRRRGKRKRFCAEQYPR